MRNFLLAILTNYKTGSPPLVNARRWIQKNRLADLKLPSISIIQFTAAAIRILCYLLTLFKLVFCVSTVT